MNKMTLLLGALIVAFQARADDGKSLAELARHADLIAIVRVEQTDYEKTREFPSKGRAILKVLVPYRGAESDQLVEVEEEGLEETACYYPEVGPFEFEGRRFLVFLNKSADKDTFRGRSPGCLIPVLVTRESGYAVLQPVDGLVIADEHVQEIDFSDPGAVIDATTLTFAEADRLESEGIARRMESDDPLAPEQDLLIFKRGVPINGLRSLMFPEEG